MGLFNRNTSSEKSSNNLINEFLNKSEGLQRILEKETEYFRDMKMKQAELLIKTKLDLVEEIETIKTSLTADPLFLKTLPDSEKKKIRTANDSLMNAAEENYHETLKAKEVNQLILEAISEAVAQHGKVDGAYGDTGSHYKNDNNTAPIAIIHNA